MESMNETRTSAQRYVDILTEAGFKAVFGVEKNKDVLIARYRDLPCQTRASGLTSDVQAWTGLTSSSRCSATGSSISSEDAWSMPQRSMTPVQNAGTVTDTTGLLNTGVPKFDRSDNEIWRDRYVSEYTFREKVSYEVVDETIFLTFVELDRFDKELEECGSMAEKWFYSMKHMGRMERLPEELRVQVFERLFEACEIARFTPEEKLEYEIRTRYDDRT